MKNKKFLLFRSFRFKVTLTIFAMMIICSLIWTSVMFINMRDNAIKNFINDEKTYVDKLLQNVNNIEEVCNMSLQIVSNIDSIREYIENVQQGNELDTREKIAFYGNDIASIYNITNLNPYLYQIRLFVDSDNITEKKPCLYRIERLNNLPWAETQKDGQWIIDYPDTVFPNYVSNYHVAGITKTMYNTKGKRLCILEVATEMSLLFPDIYKPADNTFAYFIEDNGIVHCTQEAGTIIGDIDDINDIIHVVNSVEEDIVNTKIQNESVILSKTYIPSFNGTYVHIVEIDNSLASYYNSQSAYILVVIVSLFICLFIAAFITKNIFKRFNILTKSINYIKEGHTERRVVISGSDEISELAEQIDQMLAKLHQLNEENTTRQLIVKNTEIKALQNQINAHFMYNVLETIKMMAEIEEQYDISDAVTSLGQMFRYSVKWTSGRVELKEELEYIKNYLALMNLRLDYPVNLSLSIDSKYMEHKIPKMSLQPIIENSILHGIEGIDQDTTIYVKVYDKSEILRIEISDNGKGMSEETLENIKEKLKGKINEDEANAHGLALKNVQDRIKMYYGDEFGIEIYSKLGLYTKVTLLIPYDRMNN